MKIKEFKALANNTTLINIETGFMTTKKQLLRSIGCRIKSKPVRTTKDIHEEMVRKKISKYETELHLETIASKLLDKMSK